MRICDLKDEDVHIGLRVRGIRTFTKIGTIVKHELVRGQDYWWIEWDDEKGLSLRSGFFFNDCECEIV